MRIACWITKATDTRAEYVILTDFQRQQNERASISRLYVPCPSSALFMLTMEAGVQLLYQWHMPCHCMHATGIVTHAVVGDSTSHMKKFVCARVPVSVFVPPCLLAGTMKGLVTAASVGSSLVTFRRPAQLWRCPTYSASCLLSPTLLRYVCVGSFFLRNRLHGQNWWIGDEMEKIAREGESYLILLV